MPACITVCKRMLSGTYVSLMITAEENANYEAKKVHLDNLYHMVQYCENNTDCRRSQQMAYFGEIFDRKHCSNMKKAVCDNCASKVRTVVCIE